MSEARTATTRRFLAESDALRAGPDTGLIGGRRHNHNKTPENRGAPRRAEEITEPYCECSASSNLRVLFCSVEPRRHVAESLGEERRSAQSSYADPALLISLRLGQAPTSCFCSLLSTSFERNDAAASLSEPPYTTHILNIVPLSVKPYRNNSERTGYLFTLHQVGYLIHTEKKNKYICVLIKAVSTVGLLQYVRDLPQKTTFLFSLNETGPKCAQMNTSTFFYLAYCSYIINIIIIK